MRRILVFAVALALAGAGAAFATGAQEGAAPASKAPPKLEITTLYYFDNGDATQNPDLKAEYPKWFSEHFKVDLKLNYYPRPEYMEKFTLALSSGEIHGVGQIFGGSYADDYFNDGATVDVLPYIKDNPNWLKLDKKMRDSYLRGDKLIAFPSAWEPGGYFLRSIRKDWLDKFGLKMPETIDQLYEAVKKFTLDDPDGNGKKDTVGMTSSGVWNMQDIFHSFGVPTNHVGDHCVTPDPHDGMRFNDGMLKPQMVDCLKWLADVYKNGYMDPELWTNGGSQMRERMQSGYAGSTYYWNTWVFSFEAGAKKVDPKADIEGILGLTSKFADKYTNLGGAYGAGVPWVLIAKTENAKEQANLVVDLFMANDVAHFSGWLGVYDKYWKFGPKGEIVRIPWKTNTDGTPLFAGGPNIFAGNMEPIFSWPRRGYVLQGSEAASKTTMEQHTQYLKWIEDGRAKNVFFAYEEKEKELQGDTWRAIGADVKRIFVEEVTKAMTGQSTAEAAVASYRSKVKALGAQKALQEGNAYLGRTASTVYVY